MNQEGGIGLIPSISQVILQSAQLASIVEKIYRFRDNPHVTIMQYVKSFTKIHYLAVAGYLLPILFSGDRGPIIYMLLTYIGTYFMITSKRIKPIKAILLLIVAAYALSFWGTMRGLNRTNDNMIAVGNISDVENFRKNRFADENMIFYNTAELSNCVSSYNVLYTYAEKNGISHGVKLISNILGIIPGLRFVLFPLIGFDASLISSSNLATMLMGSDHGMGTTCWADLYIDLGFWGALVVTFLIGVLVRKLDIARTDIRKVPPLYLLLLSVYALSIAIYIGRSTYATPINIVSWAWILYMFTYKILYNRKSKR